MPELARWVQVRDVVRDRLRRVSDPGHQGYLAGNRFLQTPVYFRRDGLREMNAQPLKISGARSEFPLKAFLVV